MEIGALHDQLRQRNSVTLVHDLHDTRLARTIPADVEVLVAKLERDEDLARAEQASVLFTGCLLISVGTLTPKGFTQVDQDKILATIK